MTWGSRWFVVLAVAACAKLAVGARWDLIADEAYHWTWALQPSLGTWDQPPLVGWVLAVERLVFGDHPLVLRLVPIGGWIAAVAALLPYSRSRGLWLCWALGMPSLAVLTNLAVPDALLLSCWALAMAAAFRGGRGWWVAGVFAGMASLAKYSGIAVLPLLILGSGDRRTRDPWIGLLIALGMLAPNLAWNAVHGWVTFRFQATEGLWSPHAPGWAGPLHQIGDQVLILGPIAALAVVGWMGRRPESRVDRMCLATSLPIAVGFAFAAIGGPPEAHWPAPAWIGAGLGLSRTVGRLHRIAYVGAFLGLFATIGLVVHAEYPLIRLPLDPGVRLTEGAILGEEVGRWVIPASSGDEPALPVYTERYQEAALIRWHTGIVARVLPGCGRPSQYDLDPAPIAERAWFVRPSTSGPPTCVDRWFKTVDGPFVIKTVDRFGRRVGPWDVFAVDR